MKHYNRLNELLLEFTAMSQSNNVPNLEKTDYLDLANYCISIEELELGLLIVDTAIRHFPLLPEFIVKKIEILLLLDRPNQALSTLKTIDHLTKLSHQAQLLKAKALKATGKNQDALDLLDQLKETQKDDFKIYELQANILENMQQFDKLYHVLKNQILTAPQAQLESLLDKLLLFTDITSNYQDAIAFYPKVIDRHPFSGTAWRNLGLSYAALEDYYEAIDAFEFCIAIDPLDKTAYLGCTTCLEQQNKYGLAIRYYFEYLEQSLKDEPEILMKLGHCFFLEDDFDTATYFLEEAIRLEPELANAHYWLGSLYLESDPPKAILHLNDAIDLDSFNEDYMIALAEAYKTIHDPKNAQHYFQQAIDIAPDILDTWMPFVRFLIQTKQHQLLLETLEEVATFFNPEQVIFLKIAGLFATGKRKEAKYWLIEALTTDNDLLDTMFEVYPKLAHDDEVVATIQKYNTL
ncbi:MAG TPA: tetratricopeptide repeat protein [Saprospiraceae bacterium]|nr:tetratricopeptide repeat protein [Saprospiraceae bacterium]